MRTRGDAPRNTKIIVIEVHQIMRVGRVLLKSIVCSSIAGGDRMKVRGKDASHNRQGCASKETRRTTGKGIREARTARKAGKGIRETRTPRITLNLNFVNNKIVCH